MGPPARRWCTRRTRRSMKPRLSGESEQMTPLFRAPADVKVADWRASAASEAKANTLGQSSRAASSFITPAYSRHAVGWTVQQREARASPRQDRFLLARFCFERKGATIPPPHMWLLLPLLCQGHVA